VTPGDRPNVAPMLDDTPPRPLEPSPRPAARSEAAIEAPSEAASEAATEVPSEAPLPALGDERQELVELETEVAALEAELRALDTTG
jgi:hypothetical protein